MLAGAAMRLSPLDLSVVLVALDAEPYLPGALASVPRGAEVVVADGGSRDATRDLARRLGARVVDQDLAAIAAGGGNFDLARNGAAEHAGRSWVFFLDADERISPALAAELVTLLRGRPAHAAYRVPRVNLYWGRPVRLLGEDLQLRLVQRGAGRYEGPHLHRPMRVAGTIGRLASPLVHHNVRTWRDVGRRFRRDVPIEARALAEPPPLRRAVGEPLHLLRHYLITHRAWRDGARGLLVSCLYAAYHGSILWAARRLHRA
jgi:glycosyltransferase involved in cell wall biosynthesis